MKVLVVDGTNHRLGRLASIVAKHLLNGYHVHVINAEKIIISGKKKMVLEEYRKWMEIRGRANPRKGPKHYRRPDDLVRDVIEGMLPTKKYKGRAALKRLRVHIGVPEGLPNVGITRFPEAEMGSLRNFITVGELSRLLGAEW